MHRWGADDPVFSGSAEVRPSAEPSCALRTSPGRRPADPKRGRQRGPGWQWVRNASAAHEKDLQNREDSQ